MSAIMRCGGTQNQLWNNLLDNFALEDQVGELLVPVAGDVRHLNGGIGFFMEPDIHVNKEHDTYIALRRSVIFRGGTRVHLEHFLKDTALQDKIAALILK